MHTILFDMQFMKTDVEIENRLQHWKTEDGRNLEEYLAPYINAVTDGSADAWYKAVGVTDSPELTRINAARIVAQYLVRKRDSTGGSLN